MEVVKERKRRLFAYVMAVIVLLYMHPATAIKAAQGSSIVTMAFLDSNTIELEGWTKTTAPDGWSSAEGREWYKKDSVVGEIVEGTGSVAGTEDRTHYVVEWTDATNSGDPQEAKIEISEIPATEPQLVLVGRWGSYVEVTYGSHVICKGSEKTRDGRDELEISLPLLTAEEICKNGRFFNNKWNISANGSTVVLNETTKFVPFSDFAPLLDSNAEVVVEIALDDSQYTETTVPDVGGSFTLDKEIGYTLGSSGSNWIVGEDGCTYSGGITFYVPDNAEYAFSKVTEE